MPFYDWFPYEVNKPRIPQAAPYFVELKKNVSHFHIMLLLNLISWFATCAWTWWRSAVVSAFFNINKNVITRFHVLSYSRRSTSGAHAATARRSHGVLIPARVWRALSRWVVNLNSWFLRLRFKLLHYVPICEYIPVPQTYTSSLCSY